MISLIKRHSLIFFGVNVICYFATIFCVRTNNFEGYQLLAILPLIYSIVFTLIFFPLMYIKKSYTVTIFALCCALRYILLPMLQSKYPVYGFSSFSTMDIEVLKHSILLMSYELIVCGIFFMIFFLIKHKWHINYKNKRRIYFKDGKGVIISFIIISMIITIIFPHTLDLVSFFILKSGSGTRVGSVDNSTFDMLLRQIFLIGQFSLYILFINKMKDKYTIKPSKMYLLAALVFTLLNLGIIVGEQRSSQIYFAFASMYLLITCFPKHQKQITKVVFSAAIMMLFLMTVYKEFYAFRYDSYLEALSSNKIDMYKITETAEIYLLGPQSVAASILLGENSNLIRIDRFLFDFARSFIGISFFVKDVDMHTTSNLFNLFVTNGRSLSGYLLPITSQGYIYFGNLFSPILMILILRIALYIEKIFRTSNSIYVVFFSSYFYIRAATCIVSSNLNSVVTAGSLILMSAGIIYLVQWILGNLTKKRVSVSL